MIIGAVVVALFLAILSTVAVAPSLDWQHTRRPTLRFFPISFLFILMGGLWVMPIGPELYGAPFVPMLAMGTVCSLWFAALFRPQEGLGTLYWALLVTLGATIAVWCLV